MVTLTETKPRTTPEPPPVKRLHGIPTGIHWDELIEMAQHGAEIRGDYFQDEQSCIVGTMVRATDLGYELELHMNDKEIDAETIGTSDLDYVRAELKRNFGVTAHILSDLQHINDATGCVDKRREALTAYLSMMKDKERVELEGNQDPRFYCEQGEWCDNSDMPPKITRTQRGHQVEAPPRNGQPAGCQVAYCQDSQQRWTLENQLMKHSHNPIENEESGYCTDNTFLGFDGGPFDSENALNYRLTKRVPE
jgi:hypothetical protein